MGLVAVHILSLVLALPLVSGSFCDEGNGWNVAFEENFDGDTLDESIWNIAELDAGTSYCRSAACTKDNVYIEDGHLVIRSTASRDDSKNWTNLTSGAVTTRDKATWNPKTTFRLCVSASLPGYVGDNDDDSATGQGIWPAHWMMPNDNSCWPDEGEMDIMEMINGDGLSHGTYHWESDVPTENCSYPDGHLQASDTFNMNMYEDTDNWGDYMHEYAIERSISSLAFATDSVVFLNSSDPVKWPATSDGEDTSNPLFWNVDWYLILNTAVGGDWPGEPSMSTKFPTYHRIDSVKVITKVE